MSQRVGVREAILSRRAADACDAQVQSYDCALVAVSSLLSDLMALLQEQIPTTEKVIT
jgi:hypothetical protein